MALVSNPVGMIQCCPTENVDTKGSKSNFAQIPARALTVVAYSLEVHYVSFLSWSAAHEREIPAHRREV